VYSAMFPFDVRKRRALRLLHEKTHSSFPLASCYGEKAKMQAQSYTYPQLVERMTNMEKLAKLPPVGEKTALVSSYDRSSE
jgi:hypothetical protein